MSELPKRQLKCPGCGAEVTGIYNAVPKEKRRWYSSSTVKGCANCHAALAWKLKLPRERTLVVTGALDPSRHLPWKSPWAPIAILAAILAIPLVATLFFGPAIRSFLLRLF